MGRLHPCVATLETLLLHNVTQDVSSMGLGRLLYAADASMVSRARPTCACEGQAAPMEGFRRRAVECGLDALRAHQNVRERDAVGHALRGSGRHV
jgi:hypothetical protein